MTTLEEREQTTPAVPVTPGGVTHELRAIAMVWRREMIRFGRDRTRMLAMLLQPVLFLFVMGTGLAGVVDPAGGMDFRTFLFPGVLAISVLFSAAFAGISLVWDREFGFLREMLVAPVSKTAIVLGKCLGGATVATLQSVVLLALAGVVGVPYDPVLLLKLLALLFVGALMLTALGVLVSARIKQVQAAMPASQLIIMPMMFLSGALFPLSNLPGWLATLTTLNPLTYVVQPMRAAVFEHVGASPEARAVFDTTISWGAWDLPVGVQIVVAIGCTAVLAATAIALFNRNE